MDEGVWQGWATAQKASGRAEATIRSRRGCFRSWSIWIGDRLWEATHRDIEAWLASRPIGPAAKCRAVSDLAGFYRWAQREGHVAGNPTALVDRPRRPKGIPRPISHTVLTRALETPEHRPGLTLSIAVMAYGGLRCVEVSRMRAGDIDLEAGVLYIEGKGGKQGWVPILAGMRPYLYSIDGAPGDAPIFPRADDPTRALSAAGVSQQVSAHLKRTSGRDVSAHQLRHYYGGQVLKRTGKLEIAQLALRHSSIATTQVYAALPGSVLSTLTDVW